MNKYLQSVIAAMWVSGCMLAHADDSPPSTPPAGAQLPKMTVKESVEESYAASKATTATKTDTSVMEIPVNIQVVTQEVIQDQRATNLDTVLNNVSGVLSYEQTGNEESVIIRGFETNQTIFYDGFRIYDHFGNGLQNLTDIDRVEVVKGPAATLYGEAEPGGIVNLVSKRPLATPYYSFEQTVGSWNHYISQFDATGPLNDSKAVLYRVDGSFDRSDSWRDGIYNKYFFIAPTFTWHITDHTEAMFKVAYTHNPMVSDNGQIVPLLNDRIVSVPRTVNFYDPAATGDTNDTTSIQLDLVHQFTEGWSIKSRSLAYSAKGSGTFVNGSFVLPGTPGNIGSGYNVQLGFPQYDSGAAATQTSNEKNLATELDLLGHLDMAGLRHTLLIGTDYAIHSEPIFVISGVETDTFVVPVSHTVSTPVYLDPQNLYSANTRSADWGLYAQDQLKVPFGIDLLVGLRYQNWKQTAWAQSYGATNVANGFAGYFPSDPYASSAVTPRVGVVWEAQPWLSVYAQYSDNFFPNTGLDYRHQTLKATGARNEEVGAKLDLNDGALTSTVAYFDLTKTNVTTADLVHFDQATGAYDYQATIGAVNSRGLEWDLQGRITSNWNAIFTYAYTDAKITVDTNTPSTVGNRLQNVPYHSGSAWNTYDFLQGSLSGLTVGGGVVVRGSSVDQSNAVTTPGYAVINAMMRYRTMWASSKVTAQLNVNNLFNIDYFASSSYDYACKGCSYAGVTYGAPRAVEATIKLDF